MILGTIKKMDQKNRVHIPKEYLKLAGITDNDYVNITCCPETDEIIIQRVQLSDQQIEVFEDKV